MSIQNDCPECNGSGLNDGGYSECQTCEGTGIGQMRNYKALIESGNAAQLEKLMENEHKRGFENIDIPHAFRRMSEELDEAHIEMCKYGISNRLNVKPEKSVLEAIRHEAANIANFAHMIIYRCDQELEK